MSLYKMAAQHEIDCRDDEYSTITLLKMTLQIACYVIGTTAVADTMVLQPPIPE